MGGNRHMLTRIQGTREGIATVDDFVAAESSSFNAAQLDSTSAAHLLET
jgi:hypothetical protein